MQPFIKTKKKILQIFLIISHLKNLKRQNSWNTKTWLIFYH